jgi:hypothetical protein
MYGPCLSFKLASMTTPITFRQSNESDAPVLRRLAELDSARPIAGDVFVAEHAGRAIAAVSVDERRVIADPFQPTAEVVDLLWHWALQARAA